MSWGDREQPGSSGAGLSPRTIGGLLIAVLALVFVFQNTGSSRIHVLFWSVELPGWLWMLVLFAAGVVVGSLFPWFRRRRRG